MSTYLLDGAPVDLEAFLADNAETFTAEDIAAARALKPGRSVTYGGGAVPVVTLFRRPLQHNGKGHFVPSPKRKRQSRPIVPSFCTFCGARHEMLPCRTCPECLGMDDVRFDPWTGARLEALPPADPHALVRSYLGDHVGSG